MDTLDTPATEVASVPLEVARAEAWHALNAYAEQRARPTPQARDYAMINMASALRLLLIATR